MGIGEECPGSREAVDVRGASLRVAVEAADPVILIIDGDHQDIGAWAGLCAVCSCGVRSEAEHKREAQQAGAGGGTLHRGRLD